MIEILMCTYNGEKFIEKQLNSLINQTLLPDKVKIFDDKSTDNTVDIINNFINKNELKNWFLTINESQKGWRRNFYDAIKQSTGDIIFFCDQDDIWKDDKIDVMSKALIENNLLRLNGMQYIIDENDQIISNNIVTCSKNYNNKITFERFSDNIEHFKWKNRIGCAMVLSKELVDMIKYFDFNSVYAHDVWAVELSSLLNRGAVIEYPCINYRVHSNNATANLKLNTNNIYETKKVLSYKAKESFKYFFDSVNKMKDKLSDKQYILAKNMLDMIILRNELLEKKSIFIWIKLIKYIKYYPIKKTYIADLIDIFNVR